MSTKLNLLERQLGRGTVNLAAPDNAASKMMLSYQAECERKAETAIKEMEAKLVGAQAEITSLKAQLAYLVTEATQKQKALAYKIDDVKDVAKQEIDNIKSKHSLEMQQFTSQLEALRKEYAKECEGKIRAETERDGAIKTSMQMEQMVAKLQAVRPVAAVIPPAKPKPLLEFKVSARDENGRIVSFKQIS